MATVQTSYPGNLALEKQVWTLTIAEATAAMQHLNIGLGTYWHRVLAQPTRRAKRAKHATVTVYTAGYSTGELANVLALDNPVVNNGIIQQE